MPKQAEATPVEGWRGGKTGRKPQPGQNYYKGCVMIDGKQIGKNFYWNTPKSKNNYDTQSIAEVACRAWIYIMHKNNNLLCNEYRGLSDGSIEVKLSQGKTMIIDEDDLDKIENAFWSTYERSGSYTYYAHTSNYHGKPARFHRVITNYDETDHKNSK